MSNLLQSPFVIVPAGFFVGVIVTLAIGWLRSSAPDEGSKSGREHQIRAFEADQRVSHKRILELEDDLTSTHSEMETLTEEKEEMRKALEERDAELAEVRKSLTVECNKTAKLRKELTGRAEETIRAKAQIKDIETELDVVQAGSDAVAEQFERMAKENEDLTGKHKQSELESPDSAKENKDGDEKSNRLESTGFILDS